MGEQLMRAAAAFAATNLDDLLFLCLLFGQAEGWPQRRNIVLGQVLGLLLLTAVSIFGALGLGLLPQGWLRLLGLVPILLGLRMVFQGAEQSSAGAMPLSVAGVAGLAFANGGDNIGVYLPMFSQMTGRQMAQTAAVFLLLSGIWCLLAGGIGSWPRLQQRIRQWGRWLVPGVFILLGISIMLG